MLRIAIAFVLLVPFLSFAQEAPAERLAQAQLRLQTGNTAEARQSFTALLAELNNPVRAYVGIARSYQAEGEYARALRTIDDALKTLPKDALLLGLRAELLYLTGEWEKALEAANAAIGQQKEHFLARWIRAQIFRDTGELTTAQDELVWFIRTYKQRSNEDNDIKDPEELLLVGLAGLENARWNQLAQQFRFVLNEIYADALKYDKNCWQAEYLSGMLLLEKYNRPEAMDAFDKALAINPRAAEAFVGKGLTAMQKLEIKDAERYVNEALKLNPRLTTALRLKADIHLMLGELGQASNRIDAALAVNGREEETLARKALLHVLRKESKDFETLTALVEKRNPKPGVFYQELGNALEERRYYTEAEKYYQKAIAVRENLAGPKIGLGMLYMRLGDEKKAQELLDKAFQTDPFNVRVSNSRKVLKHLEKYATRETAHYLLRYDPALDGVLADFLADYLEEVHAELAKQFGYEPQGKILIEVFNNHEMFSGRTVALPDLHTIGACTGRVVTLVSPNEPVRPPRRFNWGRVIRHELVHVFNLAQTAYQVPHWLTEGLAVRNEKLARPREWNSILRAAFDSKELLNLDTIQLGFVRPRSPEQWALAYCQSQLYVDYVIQTYGIEAIGKFLKAYEDGRSTAAAVHIVTGQAIEEFEKGYLAYLRPIIDSIPPAIPMDAQAMTLTEQEKAYASRPEDHDLGARLAGEYLRRKRPMDARKIVDGILQAKAGHPLASVVKARLQIASGENEQARSTLEASLKAFPDDYRVNAALARLCMDAKEWTRAVKLYEHCRKVAPYQGEWLEQLVDLYTKLENPDKLLTVLRELAALNGDNLSIRVSIAELLLNRQQYAEAEAAAHECLRIDVMNEKARSVLLTALEKQSKNDEARRIAARFKQS